MANFNALFAGYESFMEGDIEINNDVTVPAGTDTANEGEAIEAETTAEEMGSEGSDISGDIDEESAKTENANMVFDQLFTMYDHVKKYGIDRTFLSLYNSNGQLSNMINYRFPSCESMDSVGSPRSQASRAFIAAMEDEKEGIFKRFWNWLKQKWASIADLFGRIMNWVRDIFGNLDVRVGRLLEYYEKSVDKTAEERKDVKVIAVTPEEVSKVNDAINTINKWIRAFTDTLPDNTTYSVGGGTFVDNLKLCSTVTSAIAETFKDMLRSAKAEINAMNSADKQGDKKKGTGLKNVTSEIDKSMKTINSIGAEKKTMSELGDKCKCIAIENGGSAIKLVEGASIAQAMPTVLSGCGNVLRAVLGAKQAFDTQKRSLEMVKQQLQQNVDQKEDGSKDKLKDLQELTKYEVTVQNMHMKLVQTLNALVRKACAVAASYSGCVKVKQ